jgi:hypothetical protein
MIKINTIYRTKKDCFILIIRNPEFDWYELHFSRSLSDLQDFDCLLDFDYLLDGCNTLLTFNNLSDVRFYARKMIDGEDFSIG